MYVVFNQINKKNKITITFAKNGYYNYTFNGGYKEYKFKFKLKNTQMADNMLDCILFSNYLKRTAFI